MQVMSVKPGAYALAVAAVCLVSVGGGGLQNAFASSAERSYEVVSPPYKGGYGAGGISAVAPNGESIAWDSFGGFDGLLSDSGGENTYLSTRSESGWSTTAMQPPPVGEVNDFSSTLEYALGSGRLVPTTGSGHRPNTPEAFLLHPTSAGNLATSWPLFGGITLERIGEGNFSVAEISASRDLCDIVIGLSGAPLVPEAVGSNQELYDLSRGCSGSPYLQLLATKNRFGPNDEPEPINPKCLVDLGAGELYSEEEGDATFNGISADGSSIFFTVNVDPNTGIGNCYGPGTVHQLFVRLGGKRTLEISRPLDTSEPFGGCIQEGIPGEVPCAGALERASAYFRGASEDGSRVFFTTKAPLVAEDKDLSSDLYMATIGCPTASSGCEPAEKTVTSLVLVSKGSNPAEAADVRGVIRVSPDGRRVYFVAGGILTAGPNAEGGEPIRGADNLYVFDDETGRISFISELCSGPGISGGTSLATGAVEDASCPSSLDNQVGGQNDVELWIGPGEEVQSTPDGNVLVFASYGQLTGDDTDTARDIYRYEETTGRLERVSVGEGGYDANGNNGAYGAKIPNGGINPGTLVFQNDEANSRALSEDGSRILFTSAEPLSSDASNGLTNVYEWHDGEVSLVSGGNSTAGDCCGVISPSGRDVFFLTAEGLVKSDTDGLPDIYDDRVGGGFPEGPAQSQPCSSDACQGPLTNPAALLVPGSVAQAPGEDFPPVTRKPTTPKKTNHKQTKRRSKLKRRAARRSINHKQRKVLTARVGHARKVHRGVGG